MRNINVVELNRIVNELKKIEKSRLSKIYLPELKLLNLRFNDSEKTSLIIDSGKVLYSTKFNIENPKNPHNFVMYLRKYLSNSIVEKINHIPGERIVEIRFKSKENYFLIIELFGKGNFILTDNEYNIKNSARKIKIDKYTYEKSIDPLNFSEEDIKKIDEKLGKLIAKNLKLGNKYSDIFCDKYSYNKNIKLDKTEISKFLIDFKKFCKELGNNGISILDDEFLIDNKSKNKSINSVIDDLYNSKFNNKFIIDSKEFIKNEKSIEKQNKLINNFMKEINLLNDKINFLKNNLNILNNKKLEIDNKTKEKIIKTNNFEIRIKLNKKIENKIDEFYNKIKKLKSKIEGAKKTIETLSKREIIKTKILKKIEIKKVQKWYEKFRWFYTKENNLVIGGRDATTNEILIKKYMEKDDLVFHTIEPGSPFFILKSKNPDPSEINDVAIATASYSKQWSNKVSSSEVFYVKSEQVSKNANPGEFLNKGSFMIRGKKNFLKVKLGITIGNSEGKVIGGPFSSINNKTKNYVKLTPGFNKKSDVAKKISKKLKLEMDEIMKFLPNGTSKIL